MLDADYSTPEDDLDDLAAQAYDDNLLRILREQPDEPTAPCNLTMHPMHPLASLPPPAANFKDLVLPSDSPLNSEPELHFETDFVPGPVSSGSLRCGTMGVPGDDRVPDMRYSDTVPIWGSETPLDPISIPSEWTFEILLDDGMSVTSTSADVETMLEHSADDAHDTSLMLLDSSGFSLPSSPLLQTQEDVLEDNGVFVLESCDAGLWEQEVCFEMGEEFDCQTERWAAMELDLDFLQAKLLPEEDVWTMEWDI